MVTQEKYKNWGLGFQLRDPINGWDMIAPDQTPLRKAEYEVFKENPIYLQKLTGIESKRVFRGLKGLHFLELVEKKLGKVLNCTLEHYRGNLNDRIDEYIAGTLYVPPKES
jgi:hypothetical protein